MHCCAYPLRVIILVLVLGCFPSQVKAKGIGALCTSAISKAANHLKNAKEHPAKSAIAVAKLGLSTPGMLHRAILPVIEAGAYPIWATQDLVRAYFGRPGEKESRRERFFDRMKPHLLRGLGYGMFLFISQGTFVSTDELKKETEEFEEPREDDVIVITNTHTDDETAPYKQRVELEFDQRFSSEDGWLEQPKPEGLNSDDQKIYKKIVKKGSRIAILIEPQDFYEADSALIQISKRYGPITKHDYRGHALPGQVLVNGIGTTTEDIKNLGEVKNVYAKDARVRAFSCLLMNGEEGEAFAKAYAEKRMQNGGKFAGTQLPQLRYDMFYAILTGHSMSEVGNRKVENFINYMLPVATSAGPLIETVRFNSQKSEETAPLKLADMYKWQEIIKIREFKPQ